MKVVRFLLFFLIPLIPGGMPAVDLGAAVGPLENPTLAEAKLVLAELDRLIAEGDARTVTLGKKMRRSVRRIFTQEHRVQEAKKKADEDEARARQLRRNGDEWLRPNVHGRTNKIAARAAYSEARTIRKKSQWRQEELSQDWREEVLDFEKMLGDLEFSQEWEALVILADTLAAIVERTPWVDRPELSYPAGRRDFLRERAENQDRWLLLARHAAEAGDFELSHHFYRSAGDREKEEEIAKNWAAELVAQGHPGTAISLWQSLGERERVEELQAETGGLEPANFKVFGSDALLRRVAPACVRILTEEGLQSGFFVKMGGFLVTCREGLIESKKDEKNQKQADSPAPTVVLRDGRRFPARLLGPDSESDLVLLKIEHEGHAVLPLASGDEVQAGRSLLLAGYEGPESRSVVAVMGTVLSTGSKRGDSFYRLAMDGSEGQRGGPLLDPRGRVLGVFLSSKTGEARVRSVEAVRKLLGKP